MFHPYWLWEESKTNMWGSVDNKDEMLKKAVVFTGDHKLYGSWMEKVVDSWKYSCEHNLSKKEQNRQAWLGHAACAMAFDCPEDIVRQAWWMLSEEQRILANMEADKFIKLWEERQCQRNQLEFQF